MGPAKPCGESPGCALDDLLLVSDNHLKTQSAKHPTHRRTTPAGHRQTTAQPQRQHPVVSDSVNTLELLLQLITLLEQLASTETHTHPQQTPAQTATFKQHKDQAQS